MLKLSNADCGNDPRGDVDGEHIQTPAQRLVQLACKGKGRSRSIVDITLALGIFRLVMKRGAQGDVFSTAIRPATRMR